MKIYDWIESEGGFAADCVQKRNINEYNIRFNDMNILPVCYEFAKKQPGNFQCGVPNKDGIKRAKSVTGQTELKPEK